MRLALVCFAGFIFSLRQPFFSEKAHVLEFAFLGWFIMCDLKKSGAKDLKTCVVAFILVASVGILEETYQKILPWRVCDIRDVITDIISGTIGIFLFLLSRPKKISLSRA